MKTIDCARFCLYSVLCWMLPSWLSLTSVMAADWQGTLQDGSRVEVDASTHRAWKRDGDRVVPLWDGVHQLEDGSTVIVRDGTAVPTKEMLDSWIASPEEESPRVASACDDLIKRVCGADNRCATSQPCGLAHQLADMSVGSSARQMGADARIKNDDQCREALTNPLFVPCE